MEDNENIQFPIALGYCTLHYCIKLEELFELGVTGPFSLHLDPWPIKCPIKALVLHFSNMVLFPQAKLLATLAT